MFGQTLPHHIPRYGTAFICKNHIRFNDNQASFFNRKNYVQVVEKFLISLKFILIPSYLIKSNLRLYKIFLKEHRTTSCSIINRIILNGLFKYE